MLEEAGLIATIKRGAWTANVFDMNKRGFTDLPPGMRYRIRLDYPNGFDTSWPVIFKYEATGEPRIQMHELDPPRDAVKATKAAAREIQSILHDRPSIAPSAIRYGPRKRKIDNFCK